MLLVHITRKSHFWNLQKRADVESLPSERNYFVINEFILITYFRKVMIFEYEDGSMRVVVSTANLYEDDWHNRVQG